VGVNNKQSFDIQLDEVCNTFCPAIHNKKKLSALFVPFVELWTTNPLTLITLQSNQKKTIFKKKENTSTDVLFTFSFYCQPIF